MDGKCAVFADNTARPKVHCLISGSTHFTSPLHTGPQHARSQDCQDWCSRRHCGTHTRHRRGRLTPLPDCLLGELNSSRVAWLSLFLACMVHIFTDAPDKLYAFFDLRGSDSQALSNAMRRYAQLTHCPLIKYTHTMDQHVSLLL